MLLKHLETPGWKVVCCTGLNNNSKSPSCYSNTLFVGELTVGISLQALCPRGSLIEWGGFYLPPTEILILSAYRKEISPETSSLVGTSTAISWRDSLSPQLLGLLAFHLFSWLRVVMFNRKWTTCQKVHLPPLLWIFHSGHISWLEWISLSSF